MEKIAEFLPMPEDIVAEAVGKALEIGGRGICDEVIALEALTEAVMRGMTAEGKYIPCDILDTVEAVIESVYGFTRLHQIFYNGSIYTIFVQPDYFRVTDVYDRAQSEIRENFYTHDKKFDDIDEGEKDA